MDSLSANSLSNKAKIATARFIASRYVSVGKRSHLVSFMSAISIFGLALGIAILITVLSVMNGFDREMRENILGIVPHLTISTDENLGAAQWRDIRASIAKQSSIVAVAPVIEVAGIAATGRSSRGVVINGIEAESESKVSAIGRFVRQGSLEALIDTRWGVVIGEPLAEQLGVGLGDEIDLFSSAISINPISPRPIFKGFTVVGLFKVGSQELDNALVITNLSALKALFRIRAQYNGLRLRSDDVLAADQIRLVLYNEMPYGVTIASWTSQFGAIYQNIQFSRTIIGFMLWLLIGVAAFNLVVSMIMIVRDKTGDIAILRTMGASPKMIGHIFMWQGLFIGSIAITIGVVLGVIGSLNVSAFAASLEAWLGVQLLNAEVYPIDFLPSQLNPMDVVFVVIGVIVLSLLATIYPARKAAAIQPAQALRTE
ncbi:MAG: lipoprotein-releasing system permease protein [Pseudohongiellaceae bacterium]|jgi:lipoprotein-releasing system permease protein